MGLPNFGMVNTLLADPLKMFTKEDFVPDGADHFLHGLAPFLALFPVMVTFAVVPFGDVVHIGSRTIDAAGGQYQRRRAVYPGDDRNRRIRRRARRMVLEQPLGAARRHPRERADDLLRNRAWASRSSRS